jgi:hypothetical protein
MKAYGGGDVEIHIFLNSALVWGQWSTSRPGRFTPRERAPGTHSIGGWVDPRTGLDDVEKRKFLTLPGLELRPLSRPARSQSQYRLTTEKWSTGMGRCDHHFVYVNYLCFIYRLRSWKTDINGRRDPLRWPRDTLYPQKLALTSPTSGGLSVGIVRVRTKSHGVFFFVYRHCRMTRMFTK